MYRPGLVSVTFRQLSAEQVIDVAKRAGLSGIEWGGDIHVPHGDIERAREVGEKTRAAGLQNVSYGSYYRFQECFATHGEAKGPEITAVLDTAVALGAPLVRLWPGIRASVDTASAERNAVVAAAKAAASAASSRQLRLAFEYHSGTLTDSTSSAVRLLNDIGEPVVRSLWQPPHDIPLERRIDGLRQMLPHLEHLHCFYWGPTGREGRLPLAEGTRDWNAYLELARPDRAGADGAGLVDRWVLLEFVEGDSPDNLVRDAATLRDWLSRY